MLVPDGNGWRIEGPGKERARLAYAKLDGDRLDLQPRDVCPQDLVSASTGPASQCAAEFPGSPPP